MPILNAFMIFLRSLLLIIIIHHRSCFYLLLHSLSTHLRCTSSFRIKLFPYFTPFSAPFYSCPFLEICHHLAYKTNSFQNSLMETHQKNHWTVCNITTLEPMQGYRRCIQRCKPYCCTVTPTWPFVALSVFSLCKK